MNLDLILKSIKTEAKVENLSKLLSSPEYCDSLLEANGDVRPKIDGIYDLGSEHHKWDQTYAKKAHADDLVIGDGSGYDDNGITITTDSFSEGKLSFSDTDSCQSVGSISYNHTMDTLTISHKSGNSITIDDAGIHIIGNVFINKVKEGVSKDYI